ncbi:MAG: GrpB family protein [Actinomycetota bacterium]|nr:GrpB family protein [Actinomycetota bacterium]
MADGEVAASVEPVYVVPYDPRWPGLFEIERARVEAVVGGLVEAMEHIGSTAVPGLDAKPVVDLMAGVRSLRDADRCIGPLEGIGYSYWSDDPRAYRRYFVRFADAERTARTHNLHIVETTHGFWERHLLFRDYLRTHPETAREYARLKHELAVRFRHDREAYTEAKMGFIEAVLVRARAYLQDPSA